MHQNNKSNKMIFDLAPHEKNLRELDIQLKQLPASSKINYMAIDLGETLADAYPLKLQALLLCPEKLTSNPHLEQAHQQSLLWAKKNALINESSQTILNNMHFVGVTNTSLANNALEDTTLVAEFTTFFAILDDIWDNQWLQLNKDVNVLQNILDIFLKILRGDYTDSAKIPAYDFPLYKNFCACLLDLTEKLKQKNSDLNYFIDSVTLYFNGYILGFLNRNNPQMESELSYFTIRKYTLGAQTAFELCTMLNNITINNKTRNHPVFNMLVNKGVNALALLNDIISVNKEIKENKPENIILLKYRDQKTIASSPNNPLQNAFNIIVEYFNKEMLDLMRIKQWLPYIDKNQLAELENYYQIILNEIRDNLDYYLTQFTAETRYKLGKIRYQEISINDMRGLIKNS